MLSRPLLSAGAALVLFAAAGLSLRSSATPHHIAYRGQTGDSEPPADARYRHALRRGLNHDLRGGREEMLAPAREEPGRNTAAWSLYQAAVASHALHEPARQAELEQELRREYPRHPLTLRLAASRSSPRKTPRGRPDCGPKSLFHLCQQARLPVTLDGLTCRCRLTEDGTSLEHLQEAALSAGLRATAVQIDADFLRRYQPTGIAWVDGEHYLAFRPSGRELIAFDPADGQEHRLAPEELYRRSHGIGLLVAWGAPQEWEGALAPLHETPDRSPKPATYREQKAQPGAPGDGDEGHTHPPLPGPGGGPLPHPMPGGSESPHPLTPPR